MGCGEDGVRRLRRLRIPCGEPPGVGPCRPYLGGDGARGALERMAGLGVRSISVSLDSGVESVHDGVRGVEGVWRRTLEVIREAADLGMMVQVNTVVMRDTVDTLPETLRVVLELGAKAWEVFYFVSTGRGSLGLDLFPREYEDVSHYLYEASKYGVPVRTAEGPMFRRVAAARRMLEEEGLDPDGALRPGPLYRRLISKTREMLGAPRGAPMAHTTGTRDGKGVLFVARNGLVYPSGFLPLPVGNVRTERLATIYRQSPVLRGLRSGELLQGKCGKCEYRDICGGSRARAYAYTGNPYAEDPACPYTPGSYDKLLSRKTGRHQH
ncbi:MAG: radical SAM/SPASM domain-containing protein [Candidatus Korarchaeota archaeon]|nr:radical SAM/SPASM domain-containing protein [Candidatus Korarchaeota archaeon]